MISEGVAVALLSISVPMFMLTMYLQFINSKNKILAMIIFVLWELSELIGNCVMDKFIR